MKRETFEIIWPFIEEMNRADSIAQKAHNTMHEIGIEFVPWVMAPTPHRIIANILLNELNLPSFQNVDNMTDQVWNFVAGIDDKELYYKTLCDLINAWETEADD